MKAFQIREPGGPDRLVPEDLTVPEPGPDQLRIRVAAAGVNFVEVYQRKGQYPMTYPFTPGAEFSGTVDKVGSKVMGFRPGDRVVTASGQGAYAEYALAPAEKVVHLPEGVPFETAAALALQGLTAHYLTASTYPLHPGDTALVHAAAGGVGLLLVQLAKIRGARVLGTVSTPEKAELARKAGADQVILYTETDFAAETERLIGPRSVDVVYDSVGRTTFEKGLGLLRPRGTMVLFGQSSGPVGPLDPQVLSRFGSLFLTRPTLGDYIRTRDELLARSKDLFDHLATGRLQVRVDRTFPLARAPEAHAWLEGRNSMGKVLLVP